MVRCSRVKRTRSHPTAEPPEPRWVMPDGGRVQRREHFAPRGSSRNQSKAKPESGREQTSHWREQYVSVVPDLRSDVSEHVPCPEFPNGSPERP